MDGRPKRPPIKTEAIYSGGKLHPATPLVLPEGTAVRITVESSYAPAVSEAGKTASPAVEGGPKAGLERLSWLLFGLGMFVYLFTRLWRIDKFPIYFFADEAANPLFARDLFDHGFRNAQGISFPLYFELAANRWGPLFSVYIHAFSSAMFGRSVVVTRTTQALVSLLAPLAVALILKQVFKARSGGPACC